MDRPVLAVGRQKDDSDFARNPGPTSPDGEQSWRRFRSALGSERGDERDVDERAGEGVRRGIRGRHGRDGRGQQAGRDEQPGHHRADAPSNPPPPITHLLVDLRDQSYPAPIRIPAGRSDRC